MRIEYILFFFFQAEDGIRDLTVTGVQTCALPISLEQPAAGLPDCEPAGLPPPSRTPRERCAPPTAHCDSCSFRKLPSSGRECARRGRASKCRNTTRHD